MLNTLRRKLRHLEPSVRELLARTALAGAVPWMERRALFRFQREPLARGVAAGLFCGLIPGPLQLVGAVAASAWLRGNVVAGAVTTFYTNPLTTVPLYVLAFHVGALVLPGDQSLPPFNADGPAGAFSVQALAEWMQALGTPLLVGLPVLGLILALVGYAAVQALWLAPVLQRGRRWQRARAARSQA